MIMRSTQWPLVIATWGLALYTTLELRFLPTSFFGNASVCGPWGCAAPLPVVVAWHAFWFALLAPAGLVAARSFSPRTVRLLGLTLVNAAFLLLVAYGAWDMATWWPHARDWGRPYVVQRFLFAIVTLYDAPQRRSQWGHAFGTSASGE